MAIGEIPQPDPALEAIATEMLEVADNNGGTGQILTAEQLATDTNDQGGNNQGSN